MYTEQTGLQPLRVTTTSCRGNNLFSCSDTRVHQNTAAIMLEQVNVKHGHKHRTDSQVPLGENATACTDPGDLQCAQMLQDLLPVAAQHAVNTQIVRHTEYGVQVGDDGHGLSGQSLLLIDLVTSARCSCSTCGYCRNTRNNIVVIIQNNKELRFFHFHDYYFDTATKCCTWSYTHIQTEGTEGSG